MRLRSLLPTESRMAAAVVAVLALLVLPQLAPGYSTFLSIHIMILALFSLSFNILFGYTGLLSFGHATFFSMGAYACGITLKRLMPSLLPGVAMGTLLATLLAAAIGYVCVRRTRIYFAMLTLAFGMMFFALVWKWRDVTGGDDGLIGIPRAPLDLGVQIPMSQLESYYYFVLAIFTISILILYKVVDSPFGLVLRGLRENPERVEFSGLSVTTYRLKAFLISGAFAGLAGSLYAPLERTVGPFSAHWTTSAEPILASLLGGTGTFFGPVVGAALFLILRDIIVRYTEFWLLWFGLILMAAVLAFRGGVLGWLLESKRLSESVPAE